MNKITFYRVLCQVEKYLHSKTDFLLLLRGAKIKINIHNY